MKKLILFLIVATSCNAPTNRGDFNDSFESVEEMVLMDSYGTDNISIPVTTQQRPPQPQTQVTQKLIKSGYISFKSEDVKKDYESITSMLDKHSAYVEHENESRTKYRISYDLTLRVVSESYDSLFSSIVNLAGEVEDKSSKIEDVTERYYDLKTRIKNKQALEKRYIEILARASEIKDILEIEKNLNEVRTDIERLQGQFKYLSKQISLSTINVNFHEQLPYSYDSSVRKGYGARLLSALTNGWQNLLSFTVELINFWPFLLLFSGIIWLLRKWYKDRKSKIK